MTKRWRTSLLNIEKVFLRLLVRLQHQTENSVILDIINSIFFVFTYYNYYQTYNYHLHGNV